jgi:hypothetical protein
MAKKKPLTQRGHAAHEEACVIGITPHPPSFLVACDV